MATWWAVKEWAWNYKFDKSVHSNQQMAGSLQLRHVGGRKSGGKTPHDPCLPITNRDGDSYCEEGNRILPNFLSPYAYKDRQEGTASEQFSPLFPHRLTGLATMND